MGMNFRESGVPTIDRETCGGCGQCARICPSQVITIDSGKPQLGSGLFMGCIACGHCMAVCPTGAITVSGRSLAPDDIVELPPPDERATADGLEALLLARRSVRIFEDREVDRAVVDRIIRMTSTAPMGIPPHEVGVVVFHGREKVQAFAEDACAACRKSVRFFNPIVLTLMRPLVGKANHELMRDFVKPLMEFLVQGLSEGQDVFTYGAPLAMLFHHTPHGDSADCHIAATYAMLAAESFGLGSCMIGTAAAFNYHKGAKAKYGITAENKIGLALAIGHPAVKFRRAVRRRLASVEFV